MDARIAFWSAVDAADTASLTLESYFRRRGFSCLSQARHIIKASNNQALLRDDREHPYGVSAVETDLQTEDRLDEPPSERIFCRRRVGRRKFDDDSLTAAF